MPLSINSLHSRLHLWLFQRCLLLQAPSSSLHLHSQASCHSMILVSLVLDTKFNTLTFKFISTSGTHHMDMHIICIWIIDIITTTAAFIYTVGIKEGFITVDIYYLWSYFILSIIHSNTFHRFTFNTLQPKNVIATTDAFLINLNIFISYYSFSLNICECLIYH